MVMLIHNATRITETRCMQSVSHCSLIPRPFGRVFKWSGNVVSLVQATSSRKLMHLHTYIYITYMQDFLADQPRVEETTCLKSSSTTTTQYTCHTPQTEKCLHYNASSLAKILHSTPCPGRPLLEYRRSGEGPKCLVLDLSYVSNTGVKIMCFRHTSSDNCLISWRMDSIGRLLSRPRVKGTMQKLHMFSQPRMIELRSEKGRGKLKDVRQWKEDDEGRSGMGEEG